MSRFFFTFFRYGHFSGINRKIQFKYLGSSRDKPEKSPCEDRGRHGYASGTLHRFTEYFEPKQCAFDNSNLGSNVLVYFCEIQIYLIFEVKNCFLVLHIFFINSLRPLLCLGAEQNGDEIEDNKSVVRHPSLLLIMKWGGELTPFGREQAVEMGKACRLMSCILHFVSYTSLVAFDP